MTSRLVHIEIDESRLPAVGPDMEQERRVALFDLMEENRFGLGAGAPDGPYRLRLAPDARRLHFEVTTGDGAPAADVALGLDSLDQAVKDYLSIRDTYHDAIRTLPPARIEAVDQARREIHAAAALELRARLTPEIEMDDATAKRFFTLICAMFSES